MLAFFKSLFFCAKQVAEDIKEEQRQQKLPEQQQDLQKPPPRQPDDATWQPSAAPDAKPSFQPALAPERPSWSQVAQGGGGGGEGGVAAMAGPPRRQHFQVPPQQAQEFRRPVEDQSFGEGPPSSVDTDPTREELQDITAACQRLWRLDTNRLQPGQDYEIDVQGGTKVYQRDDMAQSSLFKFVSRDILSRPTFARFMALLDNYERQGGRNENETPEDLAEQKAFIEEISRTSSIQYVHKLLLAKGAAGVGEDARQFKQQLRQLWFGLLRRGGGERSSSAFEHIFVGEFKKKNNEEEVSGFHNWIQFYNEELNGTVDYKGFIFPRNRNNEPDPQTQLLTIQFSWHNTMKAVSSTLIGVSPEFELALYTLVFYLGAEDNFVTLGPYKVNIKCYRMGNDIGSVFPIAV